MMHSHQKRFFFSSPIAVTLDTVTLVPLRTLTLAVFLILVEPPLVLTPPRTSPWNVLTVTLDTGAVFLIFF